MVTRMGFEPMTSGLGIRPSILLKYRANPLYFRDITVLPDISNLVNGFVKIKDSKKSHSPRRSYPLSARSDGGGRGIRTLDGALALRLKRPDRSSTPVIPPEEEVVGALGIEPRWRRLRVGPDFHFQAYPRAFFMNLLSHGTVAASTAKIQFMQLFQLLSTIAMRSRCYTRVRARCPFDVDRSRHRTCKRPRNPRPSF